MAALPGRVHIPGHQPPVEHGHQAPLLLILQGQSLDHLHVAAVTVEEHKLPGTVAVQVLKYLLAEQVKHVVVDIDGAGVVRQTLAGAVGDGGGDEHVALLLNLLQQVVRDQGVRAKGHVPAMALDAADADKHHVALLKVLLDLGPGHIRQSHSNLLHIVGAANTDADCPKVHLLSNLNGIQVMIAIGIHHKAFHLLAGAHIDGAVEDGEVVVDLIQFDG